MELIDVRCHGGIRKKKTIWKIVRTTMRRRRRVVVVIKVAADSLATFHSHRPHFLQMLVRDVDSDHAVPPG